MPQASSRTSPAGSEASSSNDRAIIYPSRTSACRPGYSERGLVSAAPPENSEQREEDVDRVEVDRGCQLDRREAVASGPDPGEIDQDEQGKDRQHAPRVDFRVNEVREHRD